jgi:SAM-dependent methyltransferase/FKBP-type peptidyl-prolyl cis-trans isomerase 2
MSETSTTGHADRRPTTTTTDSLVSLTFALHWTSTHATHTDCVYRSNLNLWQDCFPLELDTALRGKPVGYTFTTSCGPGDLVGDYCHDDCFPVAVATFNCRPRARVTVEPRAGRFYPRGCIAGVRDVTAEDLRPMRLGAVDAQLTVDLNHPLAGRTMALSTTILDVVETERRGGRCTEVADLLTAAGPGMQARWRNRPTDFWSDQPFSRAAPEPDAAFYQKPRLVYHLDSTAIDQIERLYARLLPARGRVLDLMASWRSHLPASLERADVAGLGMNEAELQANPQLGAAVVQDLNTEPRLPFADSSFDAVVCTVSVEYLVRPVDVFAEIKRVLTPGGCFIVTFSNRWFPPKVVRVWQELHEFERPGLVLEYFLQAGYTALETWSMRGLPRPADDKYADRLTVSDPVHAVWGRKT